MAGWIRLCPQDLGWLQPSLVITSQEIPPGGYPQPEVPFLTRWGLELLLTSAYGLGGAGLLALAVKKKLRLMLLVPGLLVSAAGIVFHGNHMVSTFVLLAIGVGMLAAGGYLYLKNSSPRSTKTSP